jgi:hypothetical protein
MRKGDDEKNFHDLDFLLSSDSDFEDEDQLAEKLVDSLSMTTPQMIELAANPKNFILVKGATDSHVIETVLQILIGFGPIQQLMIQLSDILPHVPKEVREENLFLCNELSLLFI